nr:guanine nucleotide-binding protein subunit alpha-11-like [Misgurnus anguillicaudatus]
MGEMWRWCYNCCTYSVSEEKRNAIAKDNEINRILQEQKNRERREIKVLLLGTGDSGKTTFIKQMKIIHGNGFSEEERRFYAKLVHQNIFTAMKALTGAMTTLKIPYANPQNEVYSQQFHEVEINGMTVLKKTYFEDVRRLWNDTGIKLCYGRRTEYNLLDSTEYFMKNLDRIASADYIPTDQDVLRVRFPTKSINEYSFNLEKLTIRIVDVGGQKSERRKWIHCFEYMTSLIFLASLSEYDQVLEENNKENRIKESLSLFYNIIHMPWFAKASIILFLNKKDIFEEKIQISDLQTYFPDFQGKRCDSKEAMEFILKTYLQKAINVQTKDCKDIYHHFTCATDTNNIRNIFKDVKEALLIAALNQHELI